MNGVSLQPAYCLLGFLLLTTYILFAQNEDSDYI